MKIKSIYIVFFLFSFMACQKVIDVDVSDMEAKYVIEASYNATEEVVSVRITKTRNVFGTSEIPVVEGAIVRIQNEEGEEEQLLELGNGNYELTNYAPSFLTTYKMIVLIDDEEFEATAFLPEVVELEELIVIFDEGSLFTSEGYVVFMGFTDPPGPNFYRAVRIVNGDTLTRLGEQFIFDDSFSEGNYQTVPFFSSRYEIGDTVTVEFRSISKESFRFYSELFAIAGDAGQSAAPANPVQSWTNDAVGHFSAWGADVKTVIIEE